MTRAVSIIPLWKVACGFGLWWATSQAAAQTVYSTKDTAYVQAVERGLRLLKQGDCQPCLAAYKRAFTISQKSALSTLRAAACAYQCQQEQAAITYIQQAIDIDYEAAEDVWNDQKGYPELAGLHSAAMAPRLDSLITQKDKQLGLNALLKHQLVRIYQSDQQPRTRLDSVRSAYGQDSPQMRQLWQQINHSDSLNLGLVKRILAQYGYPGKSLVGPKQSSTAWLVIQHAPLPEQEAYLPLMQKAADQGELAKSSLALLLDRISVARTGKQLYGSQVKIDQAGKRSFFPIDDELNVNKRRAQMDLGPLEEYAKQFGLEYKPTTHD